MKQAVFKNQLNNIPQKLPIHVYIYLNIFGESCFAEWNIEILLNKVWVYFLSKLFYNKQLNFCFFNLQNTL